MKVLHYSRRKYQCLYLFYKNCIGGRQKHVLIHPFESTHIYKRDLAASRNQTVHFQVQNSRNLTKFLKSLLAGSDVDITELAGRTFHGTVLPETKLCNYILLLYLCVYICQTTGITFTSDSPLVTSSHSCMRQSELLLRL